ncbi:unnamed protein product, partial [Ectocarpus sp. 8 AP-2014]
PAASELHEDAAGSHGAEAVERRGGRTHRRPPGRYPLPRRTRTQAHPDLRPERGRPAATDGVRPHRGAQDEAREPLQPAAGGGAPGAHGGAPAPDGRQDEAGRGGGGGVSRRCQRRPGHYRRQGAVR